MKKILLLAALALTSLAGAASEKVTYGYVEPGAALENWGTGKDGLTQVCIRVSDGSLSGSKLVSVNFHVDAAAVKDGEIAVWAARRLSSGDLTTVAEGTAAPDASGYVDFSFPKALDFTGSQLYVGYSLTPASASAKPVCVSADVHDPYGMYSRTAGEAWAEIGSAQGLDLRAVFEGDFPKTGVSFSEFAPCYSLQSKAPALPINMRNAGCEAISSIDYKVEVAGKQVAQSIDFSGKPVSALYGSPFAVSATLPEGLPLGVNPAQVTVTAINGTACEFTAEAPVYIVDFFPVHRPLMEEYTGTWCGNCPRGAAGLQYMTDKHPDHFVGVALHTDEMQCSPAYFGDGSAAPVAYLDRVGETVDPYYGSSNGEVNYGIEDDWQKCADAITNVALSLKADWADDACSSIDIATDVRFSILPDNAKYRMAYYILADGLTGWPQSNYYSGYTEECKDDPWLLKYAEMDKYAMCDYDHVAVWMTNVYGIDGSLPEAPEVNTYYSHELSVNLEEIRSTSGESLVQDKNRLSVVAYVVNAQSGRVYNAIKCELAGKAAVSALDAAKEPAQVVWTDLAGVRVLNPERGIYVKTTVFTDGSRRAEKVMIP